MDGDKSLITHGIGKVVWTTGAIILTIVKLPFWLIYFLPPSLRQHPQWTYRQALMNELMRAFLYHSSLVEVKTPLSLEPGSEKDRFVKILPLDKELYRGVLRDTRIQPTVIGAIWYPSIYDPSSDNGRDVVLYFHGGAFVIGEGRSAVTEFAASTLSNAFHNAKVLSFSYRLASNPDSQFPAAVQDAVTAYQYLLDQEIDAQRIILAGDSAGCNIAIALLRYISDNEQLLPTPFAAVLSSPWVDIASARDAEKLTRQCSTGTDYVPSALQAWGARTYVPKNMDAAHPYISPNRQPFRTSTLLWFCVGGLESLKDEGVMFGNAMRDCDSNMAEIYVVELGNHAILGIGNMTGFATEAKEAMASAAAAIDKQRK